MTDGGDVAQRQGGGDGAVAAPPTDVPAGPGDQPAGPPGAEQSRLGSRSTWILVVCCVAQFMVILDLSIVNVALPSIQSSLNFSSADLQWVVDAYAITFAGFLMLGGRAADQFGQRRMFVAALVLFSITSLVGGAALSQRDAGRRPRRAGLQLRVHGRLLAGDHHLLVPARPPAAPRDRPVGGDERRSAAPPARCSAGSSPRRSAGAGCC